MRLLVLAVCSLLTSGAADAQRNRQPEIPAETLKTMQSHYFAAPIDRVFPAIVAAITDNNYTVGTASRDGGLITAVENTHSKMGGMGMTTKQNTIHLSITVLPSAGGTQIRVNAVDNYVYTYHGKKYRDENQSVTTADVYNTIFSATDAMLKTAN